MADPPEKPPEKPGPWTPEMVKAIIDSLRPLGRAACAKNREKEKLEIELKTVTEIIEEWTWGKMTI